MAAIRTVATLLASSTSRNLRRWGLAAVALPRALVCEFEFWLAAGTWVIIALAYVWRPFTGEPAGPDSASLAGFVSALGGLVFGAAIAALVFVAALPSDRVLAALVLQPDAATARAGAPELRVRDRGGQLVAVRIGDVEGDLNREGAFAATSDELRAVETSQTAYVKLLAVCKYTAMVGLLAFVYGSVVLPADSLSPVTALEGPVSVVWLATLAGIATYTLLQAAALLRAVSKFGSVRQSHMLAQLRDAAASN